MTLEQQTVRVAAIAPFWRCPLTHWQAVIMATAVQRAEAFLKALGLWKD
jgi:hypothetical protein